MSVSRAMRHTKANRCAVCGGCDGDPRGKERRCFGWTTDDGAWVHCTREDLAGSIDQGSDGCFSHRMQGPCKCGQTHGAAVHDIEEKLITYDYRDEHGVLRFQVVRMPGKKFRQRRPDGAGGWIWNLEGVERLPYRLPELVQDLEAGKSPVYIVEGEKDVDNLRAKGLTATCNPGGAGKWSWVKDMAAFLLKGREVVIVEDADEVGRKHAQDVAASLSESVVRRARCPQPHKDVSDMLAAGLDVSALNIDVDGETSHETPPDDLAPELPFEELWTPEPETNLVVPAMGLAPGPVHLVTGSWYTGKTLFLVTIGLAVASGRDVFGVHRVRRGKWMHFDHEMGRRHMKRYLQRLCNGYGLTPDDLRDHMSVRILPRLNLCTADALEHYTRLLTGYSFATFDPLRAATPGADENSSEFRQWLDMLAIVSDRTGCAIAVLHHGGKPVEGSQRRNTGRGSSAIDDAVQTKFVLTAEEKGAPILVSHEKTRELNNPLGDFYLSIEADDSGVRLVHMEPEQIAETIAVKRREKDERAAKRAGELIFAKLGQYGGQFIGGRKELLAFIGGDQNAASRAISLLVQQGKLADEGRGGARTWRVR